MKKKSSPQAAITTDSIRLPRPDGHVHDESPSATPEMREILNALLALKAGDFSVRLPGDWTGVHGKIADTFNAITALTDTLGNETARVSQAVGKGDLTHPMALEVEGRALEGEFLRSARIVNTMIGNLRETTLRNQEQDWLKTNLARFTAMLQGQRDLVMAGKTLISELASVVNAQRGTIYQMIEDEESPGAHLGARLNLLASYAHGGPQREPQSSPVGVGLIGQCALEKKGILLNEAPPDYIRVQSSLGEAPPRQVIILPVLFESETKAVIELASLHAFTPAHLSFLEQLTQSIGVVLNTIDANMRTDELLKQSQELTAQLKTRQSELQNTNQALADKAKQLADQNAEVERKNNEVEQARHALEEKAAELALTSKNKSEFLANMSHELRTPLNSILILGQQLANNAGGNLTEKQVEWARNVHSAGSELLNLINDILDLSKIESGTVSVDAGEISFASVHETIERNFRHVAESRNLPFVLELDPNLPAKLTVDSKRLQQILKNLLSNAFKFTHHGQVSARIFMPASGWNPSHPILSRASQVVAFEVTDTGIGIAPDKQRLIFEAFQQADASTGRKYGGTGLGLAITRELSALLGGEIRLVSMPNQGSTFTLFIPLHYAGPVLDPLNPPQKSPERPEAHRSLPAPATAPGKIEDDRDAIAPGDRSLLIIDDDPVYAAHLRDLARKRGFKAVVAPRGHAGLTLAHEIKPSAILLDVFLPDMLGWTVLNHLKHDAATRHIPVQMISVEEERMPGLDRGAYHFLCKTTAPEELDAAFDRLAQFLKPRIRRLLVVEDNDTERQAVVDLLAHDDIEIVGAATGEEALSLLLDRPFECVVLDLHLPDMAGFDLLDRIQTEPVLRNLPVIVFTGKDLSESEQIRLKRSAKSIVLKDVRSPERLLDETALFLHREVNRLPREKQEIIDRLHRSTDILRGRKVLIVDDDARNIYALASTLEGESMEILSATSGRQAIETIHNTPDLALVLMDIMMPEMDGIETMVEIRKHPRYRALPILAVTAKAMKGDREKCLEAGASDYLAKPINTEHLLSLLRIWLYR